MGCKPPAGAVVSPKRGNERAPVTKASQKPVIGLTGGIGSGKSAAAAELAALGCAVIDADAVGHEVIDTPVVRDRLVALWGEGIIDSAGRVSRPAVGRIVFDSPQALAQLNAIMHPPMREIMAERIERALAEDECPAAVLDAAVLLEAGWDELCTIVVFVSAPQELRHQRVADERGWDEGEIARREKSQNPLDIKASRADHVVDNSSSLSCLREQVRTLFHQLVS